jgi:hypothetical protein
MSEGVPSSIKAATPSSSVETEGALADSVCIRLPGVLATDVTFCFGLTGKSAKPGWAACAALSQLSNAPIPVSALGDQSLHGCLEHPRGIDLVPIQTVPNIPRKHNAAVKSTFDDSITRLYCIGLGHY